MLFSARPAVHPPSPRLLVVLLQEGDSHFQAREVLVEPRHAILQHWDGLT